MEISIIISGNLTGFSRFYASPNANDLYNEAKFDFDYRNFLTFLSAGDKAYAISFSPKVIAVSLITRILDSFRRPGILVVTALIPRNQLVRGQLNQNDKTAIYRLLNEVNDKFYEKNFLNGMINQNPAVLMQDYYSDILSRYQFVSDKMQKPVNARIDITSPNKRIGYVSADESSMPKYLSSLMRKSYEGYHHVFISARAPQNIEEPAEEILTYRVRIENDDRPLPGEVRLTDRIPNISPKQGEKDIPNKNFTYGQVIGGEAGTDIIGTIENGDTILLTYRFPREEKTVYFRFYEGSKEVPVSMVRPIIDDSNGTSFNIASDSYTFYGKEIYSRKLIRSANPEFTITGSWATLDLQRVQNGATINVNVERGWLWEFSPMYNNGRPATIKPINITLTNRVSGENRKFTNVTSAKSARLSGNPNDWEMTITSDYYQEIKVPANDKSYRLEKKPYQPQTYNPVGNTNGNIGRVSNNQEHSTLTGQNDHGLKISKGEQLTAKDPEEIKRERMKRFMKYGASIVGALILLIVCICIFSGKKTETRDTETEYSQVGTPVNNDNDVEIKSFKLLIKDNTGDEIKDNNILKQLTIEILADNGNPQKETADKNSNFDIYYYPEKEPAEKITVAIKLDTLYTVFKESYDIKDLEKQKEIKLTVLESDIKLYDELHYNRLKDLTLVDYNNKKKKVEDIKAKNEQLGKYMEGKLEEFKPKEKTVKPDIAPDVTIRSGFDQTDLELVDGQLKYKGKPLIPKNKAEKDRYDGIINILNQLKIARPSTIDSIMNNINLDNFSQDQSKVIQNLKTLLENINKIEDTRRKSKFKGNLVSGLKDCNSLEKVNNKINGINNELKQ